MFGFRFLLWSFSKQTNTGIHNKELTVDSPISLADLEGPSNEALQSAKDVKELEAKLLATHKLAQKEKKDLERAAKKAEKDMAKALATNEKEQLAKQNAMAKASAKAAATKEN